MAKTKPVEKPQVAVNAAEQQAAAEQAAQKGSDRIAVTAWLDSSNAVEFLVPEWFIKYHQYSFTAQPNDLKIIGREVVTPAASSSDDAKRIRGLKVEGSTKFVGQKITLPVTKAEAGGQGENFGEFSYQKNSKTVKVSRRAIRVPSRMSKAGIQYWLYTCCTVKPAYFKAGNYRYAVGTLAAAPQLAALGNASKGTAAQ